MFADPLVSTDFSVVIMNHYQQNENMFSSLGNEPERKREMNRMEKKIMLQSCARYVFMTLMAFQNDEAYL